MKATKKAAAVNEYIAGLSPAVHKVLAVRAQHRSRGRAERAR